MGRRGVREVPGEHRGAGQVPAAFGATGHDGPVGIVGNQGDGLDTSGRRGPLERLVGVAGEQDALDDHLGRGAGVHVGEDRDADGEAGLASGGEPEGGRGVTDAVRIDAGWVAHADGYAQRSVPADERMGLARVAVEPGGRQGRQLDAEPVRAGAVGADRERDGLGAGRDVGDHGDLDGTRVPDRRRRIEVGSNGDGAALLRPRFRCQ